MPHLLLVAYYFPPDGGAATQRPEKFCRYLPELGWRVTVVTRQTPERRGTWEPSDETLVHELSDAIEVIRVPEPPAVRRRLDRVTKLDPHEDWVRAALPTVLDAARRTQADALLLTMSPFSLSLLIDPVRKQLGIPVVSDLRDPWALDGWQIYWTRLHWRKHLRAMGRALERSDRVIANTPDSRAAFLSTFPDLDRGRVEVITNGYDEPDFAPHAGSVPKRGSGPFRLVHCGMILGDALDGRETFRESLKRTLLHFSPEPLRPWGRTAMILLEAMALLRGRKGPDVKFVCVGRPDGATSRRAEELGLADAIEFTGYVPHAEAIRLLVEADGLFLPLHGLPPGFRSLIVPGKTYEYLRSGRPILGCLPEGDARDLVERTGRGYCADPCDPAAIADALERMVRQATSAPAAPGGDGWVRQYERRALTQELVRVLEGARTSRSRAAATAANT